MWLTRIFSIVLILCSSIALAEDDVAGSADDNLLSRFRGSLIVNYQRQPLSYYSLPLGGIEVVNGVEGPEREMRLTGSLTRISYRIPEGNTTRNIMKFFAAQLEQRNAEKLFACNGRECGGSNYWANSVFGFSRLYGVEHSQNYLAAQLPGVTVAIYTVERGNHRVYAHLDILETDLAARMTGVVKSDGYVELSQNALPDMDLLKALVDHLKSDTPEIVLVVHHRGDTLASAKALAETKTEQLRQILKSNDISGVTVSSVGALAPSVLKQNQWVVVLVSGRTQP
jgi:hypothetical protein